MMIQNRDGSLAREPGRCADRRPSYYAAMPASALECERSVIEELIGFAFDLLGARHLELRVYDEPAPKAPAQDTCSG
jgi:hypothetical protein